MLLNEPVGGEGEQFSDEQAGDDFMAAMGTLGAVS